MVRRAADPLRPPRRVLGIPRYAAMEAAFDRIGPHGRTMMCSTAAVQVCSTPASATQRRDRWEALHELGPHAARPRSPTPPAVHGRRTGWKSSRMASWLTLDPERTSPPRPPAATPPPSGRSGPSPRGCSRSAARTAGTRPRACPSATGSRAAVPPTPPTRADLDYHLTTLFPPVRPHGHVEVRYLDQQPDEEWAVPVAVVAALISDPGAVTPARDAVPPPSGAGPPPRATGSPIRCCAAPRSGVRAGPRPSVGTSSFDGELHRRVERVVERGCCAGAAPPTTTSASPARPRSVRPAGTRSRRAPHTARTRTRRRPRAR